MTIAELELRLLALEAEVQRMMAQTEPNKADPMWVAAQSGRFKNDPGFDEIVRRGREYREQVNRDSLEEFDRDEALGNLP